MKRQTIHATKKNLDAWYGAFSASQAEIDDFIAKDPVQFPLRYKKRADVEIAAFIAATIAWGRRDIIIRSAQRIFALMQDGPSAYVMAGDYRALSDKGAAGDKSLHRTFFESDLKYFCKGFKACYEKYGSLEKLFARACSDGDIWQGISLFRAEMATGNDGACSRHIANPEAGSACKRINLALRWLARPGPVDLGLWKKMPLSALHIPLDVHVARNARALGLLERKSNDKKAVIELTEKLRIFCPEDPVKYDFALFYNASSMQELE
ncbi:MAG: TIGR02757 family protein [Treponema sp.]|nr:TIGR02757 family protein [Treponema sp.]